MAAKARKAAARHEENEKKAKEAEDKLWEDNDKNLLRKQERKAELGIKFTFKKVNEQCSINSIILTREKASGKAAEKSRKSKVAR